MSIKKMFSMLILGFFMLNVSYAAETAFFDTMGHSVQLSGLKGKWVVVNYWAGWCSACAEEIPQLNLFYINTKDKNVVMYGVDYDELPVAQLKLAKESLGIQYPILTADPGDTWNLDSVDVIPTTFIINPEGHVVKVITGSTTEDELLKAMN